MKIQMVSDLHFEFGGYSIVKEIKKCKADVLVIAGDLAVARTFMETLSKLDKDIDDREKILVIGNHDLYGGSKQFIDNQIEDYKGPTHILNRDMVELDGVTFIGATGWWDENPHSDALRGMNDFRKIFDIGPARNGVDWGIGDRKWFDFAMKEYKSDKTVCISHNCPSPLSTPARFRLSTINCCFVTDYEDLIRLHQPTAWIHGHTHDSCNYTLDKTHVICNPQGYFGFEKNKKFNPCLTLEV